MKRMNLLDAHRIATMYDDISELSEDELTEYIDALEYLIDNEPYGPEAWLYDLGWAYDSLGKHELAIRYFSLAIEKGELIGFIGLGNVYRHVHEYRKARQCYEKALAAGYSKAKKRIRELEQEAGHGFD